MAVSPRPLYPEAWNNIAAAHNSMSRWDEGIKAAEEALRLKPDYPLARNNLAWARAQQEKQKSGGWR
jgi:tetratricopeptide (TPR) repeat protein